MAAQDLGGNFEIPSKRRQELLYDLGKALGVDKVPAPFWACLQVCHLDQLKDIVDNSRHDPQFVATFAKHCSYQIPLLWLQVPQSWEPAGDSASTSTNSDTDDVSLEEPCSNYESSLNKPSRRDSGACVIKKTEIMVVAHIYPNFNARDPFHAAKFWDLAYIFWPSERIRLWKELIFGEQPEHNMLHTKVTDACFNSICISPQIYRMWRMGAFALKPLEYNAEMTELEVEWYWLPLQEHSIYDSVPLNKFPLSSSGLDSTRSKLNNTINLVIVLSPHEIQIVKTGDRFIFKTKDPENLPLPSKDLLELQFNMQRIVSMAGAAGIDYIRLHDENEDENYVPSTSCLQASYIQQWLESCDNAKER